MLVNNGEPIIAGFEKGGEVVTLKELTIIMELYGENTTLTDLIDMLEDDGFDKDTDFLKKFPGSITIFDLVKKIENTIMMPPREERREIENTISSPPREENRENVRRGFRRVPENTITSPPREENREIVRRRFVRIDLA